MPKRVRDTLREGGTVVGVWIEMMSPELVEFCGWLGFDFAVLDAEHFALDPVTSVGLVRACEVSGMTPIVRVPSSSPSVILSYLEVGVAGIYVPHVNSGQEAAAIVDAVKYAPQGHRGAGSGRYLRYGVDLVGGGVDQEKINDTTLTIALVEEVAGVENLDEILAVEGIDVVGVGPGDLAQSMGHVGEKNHPDVQRTVEEVEHRIVAAGKVVDCTIADVDEAYVAMARGSRMISLSIRGLLTRELRGFLASVREKAQA